MPATKRISLIAACTAAALLAPAATACAADLHVRAGGGDTPCTSWNPCDLAVAIDTADRTPSTRDRIQVAGPLTVTTTVDLTHSPIDLLGSGSGADGTVIDAITHSSTGLAIGDGSSAAQVSVRGDAGVYMKGAAALRDAGVSVSPQIDASVVAEGDAGRVPVIERVRVTSPTFAVSLHTWSGSAIVRDSSIKSGLNAITVLGREGATIERTTMETDSSGVRAVGYQRSTISDSVIRMGRSAGSAGVELYDGASAAIVGSTVVGGSPRANGVLVSAGDRNTPVLIQDSIVRGGANDIRSVTTQAGAVIVRTSDVATVSGAITDAGGNMDADPRFRDAANGDLRLRADSPLIDAGGATTAAPLGPFDLAGGSRVLDGDADGRAVVDMGAYEAAPGASPGTAPATPDAAGPAAPPAPPVAPGEQERPAVGASTETSAPAPSDSPAAGREAATPAASARPLTVTLRTPALSVRSGRAALAVACSAAPCRVVVTVSSTGRRPVALARAAGPAGMLTVAMTRRVLALVKQRRLRSATVTMVARDAAGRTATRTVVVRLAVR